jgi:hypothetical protein
VVTERRAAQTIYESQELGKPVAVENLVEEVHSRLRKPGDACVQSAAESKSGNVLPTVAFHPGVVEFGRKQ